MIRMDQFYEMTDDSTYEEVDSSIEVGMKEQ